MHRWGAVAAAAVAVLLGGRPTPAWGQTKGVPAQVCWWPEEPGQCRVAVTHEVSWHQPIRHGTSRDIEPSRERVLRRAVEWAAGLEVHVGGPWSAGASWAWIVDADRNRQALRGHVRRWLGPSWAVEVMPSVSRLSPSGDYRADRPTVLGVGTRLHLVNEGFVGARYDRVRISEDPFSVLETGVEGQWALEAGLASEPALVVSAIGLTGLLVFGLILSGISL